MHLLTPAWSNQNTYSKAIRAFYERVAPKRIHHLKERLVLSVDHSNYDLVSGVLDLWDGLYSEIERIHNKREEVTNEYRRLFLASKMLWYLYNKRMLSILHYQNNILQAHQLDMPNAHALVERTRKYANSLSYWL